MTIILVGLSVLRHSLKALSQLFFSMACCMPISMWKFRFQYGNTPIRKINTVKTGRKGTFGALLDWITGSMATNIMATARGMNRR